MSAPKRFLDRDSVTKALAVTALSMAALAAAPAGVANPPPNAGATFSAPGRTIVLLGIGRPATAYPPNPNRPPLR